MTRSPILNAPTAETIATLTRILGQPFSIRDEAEMAPYLTDWRDRYRGKAALVL